MTAMPIPLRVSFACALVSTKRVKCSDRPPSQYKPAVKGKMLLDGGDHDYVDDGNNTMYAFRLANEISGSIMLLGWKWICKWMRPIL